MSNESSSPIDAKGGASPLYPFGGVLGPRMSFPLPMFGKVPLETKNRAY